MAISRALAAPLLTSCGDHADALFLGLRHGLHHRGFVNQAVLDECFAADRPVVTCWRPAPSSRCHSLACQPKASPIIGGPKSTLPVMGGNQLLNRRASSHIALGRPRDWTHIILSAHALAGPKGRERVRPA